MNDQEIMEAWLRKTVEENYSQQADRINGMLKPELVSCSAAEKTTVMAYPVQDWQGNRYRVMHGGMVTTCIDNAMAMLGMYLSPSHSCATLSMEVKFLRPVWPGDTLEVTTRAVMDGSRVEHFASEAKSRDTGKVIATAAAVYMKLEKPQGEK